MERLGLLEPGVVEQGFVVRMPKAYPMYDAFYRDNVDVLRGWLAANVPMFIRWAATACIATTTRTIDVHGDAHRREHCRRHPHDVWEVNVEAEYHEEVQKKRPRSRRKRSDGAGGLRPASNLHDRCPPYNRTSSGGVRTACAGGRECQEAPSRRPVQARAGVHHAHRKLDQSDTDPKQGVAAPEVLRSINKVFRSWR